MVQMASHNTVALSWDMYVVGVVLSGDQSELYAPKLGHCAIHTYYAIQCTVYDILHWGTEKIEVVHSTRTGT